MENNRELTRREYFVAKAMQGVLSGEMFANIKKGYFGAVEDFVSHWAITIADKTLEALDDTSPAKEQKDNDCTMRTINNKNHKNLKTNVDFNKLPKWFQDTKTENAEVLYHEKSNMFEFKDAFISKELKHE